MRSKAPLALLEQTVMLLVFALAAALCLRVFVWADVRSQENAAHDKALLLAQNAAQTLKSERGDYAAAAKLFGGSWNGQEWNVYYDAAWERAEKADSYALTVRPTEDTPAYLGSAEIEVKNSEEQTLLCLTVKWQEVDKNA